MKFIVQILLLGLAGTAWAQLPADSSRNGVPNPLLQSDTIHLSLATAQELAVERNSALLGASYRLHAAEADTVGARLVPNPQLSVNTSYVNLLGRPIDFSTSSNSLRLDQVIQLGGKRGYRIETAEESVAAVRADFVNQIFQTRADVKDSYIDAAYAQKQIELAQESYDLFARLVDASQIRLKAGDIGEQDVTKLLLTELTFRQALSDAQQSLIDALARLRQTVHLDANRPVRIDYQFQPTSPVYVSDTLHAIALRSRADLWAQEHRVLSAEHQTHLAKANAWPDLDVGVELDRQGPDFKNYFGGGIGIAIPLFSRNQDDIMRTDANYRASQYDLQSVELSIHNDVATAYAKYESSLSVLGGYPNKMVDLAGDIRTVAMNNYTKGHISLLDLLESQRIYNDAIQNYYSALYKLAKNQTLLERAVGVQLF